MEAYEGWQGSFLYVAEVTPGTEPMGGPVTALGYVKNVSSRVSAMIEEEGAIGTHLPVHLEEGVIEAGGSCEILPTVPANLLIAKRSSGLLTSYSIHTTGGGAGVNHTGAKINQLRGTVDAGGRLRCTLDWVSLSTRDNAAIAAVVPTSEVYGWHELVHSLTGEVVGIEFTINNNLQRRPVIRGAGTAIPVSGQVRAPYRIKEGRQSVSVAMRFLERPSQTVISDIISNIGTLTLTFTGLGAGAPTLTFTFSNGKPNIRENTYSESSESVWPLEMIYKDWDVA